MLNINVATQHTVSLPNTKMNVNSMLTSCFTLYKKAVCTVHQIIEDSLRNKHIYVFFSFNITKLVAFLRMENITKFQI